MWKQTTLNSFTDGTDTIKIDCYGLSDFTVSKNDIFEEVLPSFNELNIYLENNNLPTITLPSKVDTLNKWFEFDGYTCEKVFSRKKTIDTTQTVSINKFSDNSFSVNEWISDYSCLNHYAQITFEFVEDLNKTPLSDLELDAYKITLHGASGMDVCHRNLTSFNEVKTLLKDKYNIIF